MIKIGAKVRRLARLQKAGGSCASPYLCTIFTKNVLRGMTFEDYLSGKKIDSALFRAGEPGRWEEFRASFEGVHPDSFTAQKKFLLNNLRRRYLLVMQAAPAPPPVEKPAQPTETAATEVKPARPAVKRPAVIMRKPPEEN
jgi:hypothetical protein